MTRPAYLNLLQHAALNCSYIIVSIIFSMVLYSFWIERRKGEQDGK